MQMLRDDHVEKARRMYDGFGPAERERAIKEAVAFYGEKLRGPAGVLFDPYPEELSRKASAPENQREATVMHLAFKLATAEYKRTGYPRWKPSPN
jgi:hypothetical protein